MTMELSLNSRYIMIGTRVREAVKERLEEEAAENQVSLCKHIENALWERWQVKEQLEQVLEELQLFMDLDKLHKERLTAQEQRHQKALEELRQEMLQRLERLVRYVDKKHNFFTDKAHREELSKVFHAPLLTSPAAV